MVREPLAAHRGSGGAAVRPGRLHRALATLMRPLHGLRGTDPARGLSAPAGRTGAFPLDDGPPVRRRLYGRLAALFFAGAGVLGLVTLPLPAPGSNPAVTAAVYAVALALGVVIWFAPW